jgi:hypothetical protein
LEGSAPLPIVRENHHPLALFRGAVKHSVHPFWGELPFLIEYWFIEINQGRIPSIFEVVWIKILFQGMILGKIHN